MEKLTGMEDFKSSTVLAQPLKPHLRLRLELVEGSPDDGMGLTTMMVGDTMVGGVQELHFDAGLFPLGDRRISMLQPCNEEGKRLVLQLLEWGFQVTTSLFHDQPAPRVSPGELEKIGAQLVEKYCLTVPEEL